jgi:phage terminase large subunit-like protein
VSFDWSVGEFSEAEFKPVKNRSDVTAFEGGCRFDWEAGQRACAFVEEFCKQSKGEWSGEPLFLLAWQRDAILRAFGWKRANGTRRFRTVHIEIPKKNGKSTLSAALALLLTVADGEPAAEVYLCAVDRQQSDIVFEESCRMVESSPDLSRRLKILRHVGRINDPRSYSAIVKNSADAPSKDGVSSSATVFDEIHRFKNRAMWDVYAFAGASRRQPMRICITTSGESADGLWFELRKKSEQVAAGVVIDESHLGIVFHADETEDLDDEAVWARVNPSMAHTFSLDDFRREYHAAKSQGGHEWANFLRLRLGIVMRSEGQYIPMDAWDRCAGKWQFPLTDSPMYIGLDLSQRDDLTAMVAIWGNFVDGFDLGARFWLPADQIAVLETRHSAPYRAWEQAGLITLTPGPTVDLTFIERDIMAFASKYDVVKIYSDPYNAERLATNLAAQGLPIEFLAQVWSNLSDATKTLLELVLSGRIRHEGNAILRWNAANAIAKVDSNGNVRLDKAKSRLKIDGLAAAVNAIAAAIRTPEPEASVYEKKGQLLL